MLTTTAESAPSIIGTISKYLLKNGLPYTILNIYLKPDLLEKFILNLGYILTKALDPYNQNNTLCRASYQKLIYTF